MTSKLVYLRRLKGVLGAEILDLDFCSKEAVRDCLFQHLAQHGLLICRDSDLAIRSAAILAGLFVPDTGLSDARSATRRELPAAMILCAERVPPEGGESIWSSLDAAYASLSTSMQNYLAPLTAAHGFAGGEVVWRPLITPHPLTGFPCLDFSPEFTHQIGGVPEEEGRLILKLLRKHLYTPENQIRTAWTDGMIAIWDCRLVHHYAVGGLNTPGWRLARFSAAHLAPARLCRGRSSQESSAIDHASAPLAPEMGVKCETCRYGCIE